MNTLNLNRSGFWLFCGAMLAASLAVPTVRAASASFQDAPTSPAPAAIVAPHYEVKTTKSVAYGTDAKLQSLDVYQPQAISGSASANAPTATKHPAVVLIHGGSWMFGDKEFYAPMARRLAERGYVAFSLNYRLAPAAHYPAQLDDVQRAVRWIRAHASEYNLDPERIGALGDSAGAHLSALLGLRETRDNSDTTLASYSSRVRCVVDLYGPTDFTLSPNSAEARNNSAGLMILRSFFGKAPQDAPDLYRDGSPVAHVNKTAAPFLILHGTADTLVPVDQSERLYTALKDAGIDVTMLLVYKAAHGFLHPGDPKQAGVLADNFLDQYLKP